MMIKPLIIYHKNCADGFGAAFAAWLKFGEDAEYLPMQYGESFADENLADGTTIFDRDVYILDFSFPRQLMERIFSRASRVVWLDHHKTALEMMRSDGYKPGDYFIQHGEKVHITLDDNKSGALLAWEYFHPNTKAPFAFRYIDDRDRWQFKYSETKPFSAWLFSHTPWTFEQWLNLGLRELYPASEFTDEGAAILRAHDQNVKSVVKGAAMKCEIIDFNTVIGWEPGHCGDIPHYASFAGLAANCPPHLTSDVGHELANQSGTFGLCWTMDKDGKVKCSLRSNGNYDVSAIAKAFGGGGHKNAAGFEVPIETLLGWMK